jgi:hypothetical protein
MARVGPEPDVVAPPPHLTPQADIPMEDDPSTSTQPPMRASHRAHNTSHDSFVPDPYIQDIM